MHLHSDNRKSAGFLLLLLVCCGSLPAAEDELPPAAQHKVDFETEIRPLLSGTCETCHGAKKQKGGLRLDLRSAALKGGDSGAVILPGKGVESRLVLLVSGTDKKLVMPPRGKRLTAAQVGALRAWIDQGAVWPEDPAGSGRIESDHWSLKPVKKPAPPAIKGADWVRNPIDAFVLARLQEKGLKPSPLADRATLIRRLNFTLLGLPPTPAEVKAFVDDKDPGAYGNLVERLLASPRYGEHWGRHWLDVARYTESQGFEYDRLRNNAWHYRDYVIRSFNSDKPYDRFMMEQVAGDVLKPVMSDGIIATSMLVCGPYDQAGNSQRNQTQRMKTREEEMEDLVSCVTQGFLGMTVNCARCHAHKFDPIPQTDYYRIKSVFDGVFHGERDFGSQAEREARQKKVAAFNAKIAELDTKVAELEKAAREQIHARKGDKNLKAPGGPRPVALWDFASGGLKDQVGAMHAKLNGSARLENGRLVLDGKNSFASTAALGKDVSEKTLEAWVYLSTLDQGGGGVITLQNNNGEPFDSIVYAEREKRAWMSGSNGFVRTRKLGGTAESANATTAVHMAIVYGADNSISVYRNGELYGQSYSQGSRITYRKGQGQVLFGLRHKGATRNGHLKGELERAALYDRALSRKEIQASLASRGQFIPLEAVLKALNKEQRDARAALLAEAGRIRGQISSIPRGGGKTYAGQRRQPKPTQRLIKGNVRDRAEVVSPGALSVISEPSGDFGLAENAPEAERRIHFARWLADPKNPLPARVMANRVWHYHFGRGIVGSPNDFGSLGEAPTHPALLDWLAAAFIEKGWRIKELHRLIVHSSTWRQASTWNKKASEIDSESRLLWRHPPKRLTAESIRDSMLSISGKLNTQMGGPSYRPFSISNFGSSFYKIKDQEGPQFDRRSVYRMNVNSGKDPLLDVFDCPDPSVKAPRRRSTTTPLQALSLMNNSLVQRLAKSFAARLQQEAGETKANSIEQAWLYAFARKPTGAERGQCEALVKEHGLETACWVIFNASEFLYVR